MRSGGPPLPSVISHKLAALALAVAPIGALAAGADYATQGKCAGYPRVALSAPAGWCVGLVADARDGLKMPRRILEMAPGRFWATDMGNWELRQGRLLELSAAGQPGDAGRVRVLAKGLDRPHGLTRGPDGRVYIGEAGMVWRTPPGAVEREIVLRDLPSDGAHPLKEIVFGDHDRMFLNVGSATDACRAEGGDKPPLPCPESAAPIARAAVYAATFGGPDFKMQSLQPWARGLRNSLGLALTRDALTGSERLWQAENSVDYTDAKAPAEELNELTQGGHFGWPYCVSNRRGRSVVARGYEKRVQCEPPDAQAAYQSWPAHVAPLQLLAVPPARGGETQRPWSDRLLAVWHGYREKGHRIVAWRLAPDGRPEAEREDIVAGWSAAPGVRPLGSPAGITVDSQGRLWVVEDRNSTVLVVAPDAQTHRK